MKLRTLKSYLKGIRNEGDAGYIMNFSDQDCDYYTITDIYEDEDGDICLEAGDGYEMNVYDILDNLKGYRGDSYVYVYAPCNDIYFDIEGGWYFDDNGDLTMDMHYSYDDDDDYDD